MDFLVSLFSPSVSVVSVPSVNRKKQQYNSSSSSSNAGKRKVNWAAEKEEEEEEEVKEEKRKKTIRRRSISSCQSKKQIGLLSYIYSQKRMEMNLSSSRCFVEKEAAATSSSSFPRFAFLSLIYASRLPSGKRKKTYSLLSFFFIDSVPYQSDVKWLTAVIGPDALVVASLQFVQDGRHIRLNRTANKIK